METVTIEKANVRKAYQVAKGDLKEALATLFGSLVISQDPMSFESYEEICAAEGIDPVSSLPFQHPKTKKEVSSNGCFKLETIFEAFNKRCGVEFNELWESDYTDVSQDKWYPIHEWVPSRSAFVYTDTGYAHTNTRLGARLCTDTNAKATRIAKQFTKEWNEFLNPQL